MQMSSPPQGFRGLLHQSRLYCSIYMPWVTWQSTLNQNPNRVFMPGIPVGANAAVTLEEAQHNLVAVESTDPAVSRKSRGHQKRSPV